MGGISSSASSAQAVVEAIPPRRRRSGGEAYDESAGSSSGAAPTSPPCGVVPNSPSKPCGVVPNSPSKFDSPGKPSSLGSTEASETVAHNGVSFSTPQAQLDLEAAIQEAQSRSQQDMDAVAAGGSDADIGRRLPSHTSAGAESGTRPAREAQSLTDLGGPIAEAGPVAHPTTVGRVRSNKRANTCNAGLYYRENRRSQSPSSSGDSDCSPTSPPLRSSLQARRPSVGTALQARRPSVGAGLQRRQRSYSVTSQSLQRGSDRKSTGGAMLRPSHDPDSDSEAGYESTSPRPRTGSEQWHRPQFYAEGRSQLQARRPSVTSHRSNASSIPSHLSEPSTATGSRVHSRHTSVDQVNHRSGRSSLKVDTRRPSVNSHRSGNSCISTASGGTGSWRVKKLDHSPTAPPVFKGRRPTQVLTPADVMKPQSSLPLAEITTANQASSTHSPSTTPTRSYVDHSPPKEYVSSSQATDASFKEQVQDVLEEEKVRVRTATVSSRAHTNDCARTQAEMDLVKAGPTITASKDDLFGEQTSLGSSQDDLPFLEHHLMALKWLLTAVSAIIVAFFCGGLITASHDLTHWRVHTATHLVNEGYAMSAFVYLLAYALIAAAPSAALVIWVAPHAAGSGIPDVRAHLNGNALLQSFTLRTFVVRATGLLLVTSAGLFAGTEGPFIHLASILASSLAQGPPGHRARQMLGWPLVLLGHRTHCEFVSQGAAMGVAAAFGAPLGGVLFCLEEAASFWSSELTWRAFFGSMVAALVVKVVKSGFTGLPIKGFIEFPDTQVGFQPWELLLFALIGAATGLLGACFNAAVYYMQAGRKRFFKLGTKNPGRNCLYARVAEVLIVATLTVIVIFWVPVLVGCRDFNSDGVGSGHGRRLAATDGQVFVGEMPHTVCGEGSYSEFGAVLLVSKEEAIKQLFTSEFSGGAKFTVPSLLASFAVVFCGTLLTFGTAIPSGIFIPTGLAGACFGRAVGELMRGWYPDIDLYTGVYALMGCSGMMAGFSRLTISLTVIMLEITNNTRLLLPLMVCNLFSKAVADRLIPSCYELLLDLNSAVNIVECNQDEDTHAILERLAVHDVSTTEVVALREYEPLWALVNVLAGTPYSGFPVVDNENHLMGIVQRMQLTRALREHMSHAELENEKYENASAESVMVPILKYKDPSPSTAYWSAPLARELVVFTATGLTHLCVIDERNRLLGLVTRTDLAPICKRGKKGLEAVQALLNRRIALKAVAHLSNFSSDIMPSPSRPEYWGRTSSSRRIQLRAGGTQEDTITEEPKLPCDQDSDLV